jgi:hypothetical protein
MKVTDESMVTFQNGSDVMTESFRNQIYQLLEQSKVVHPTKDKDRRKKVAMTKDLQQLLSKNEKRDKEDEKCEDDLLQGKFKHFKGCITTDGKDELGEDVKTGILLTSQKSFKDIITDLVEALKFHKENMEQVGEYYYEYDRQRFVSRYYDTDTNLDLKYSTDLESLATLIVQIHLYNHIIITDGEGKDIRTNSLIDEKEM